MENSHHSSPHINTEHVRTEDQPQESVKAKPINPIYLLSSAIVVGAILISASIFYTTKTFINKLDGTSFAAAQTAGQNPGSGNPAAPAPVAQAAAPGQKVNVDVGHLPPKGNPNAKVKIVAFEDFRCPFCEKFFSDTEPQIIKDYVDTGKAVLYYRQYQFLGPASVIAGNAAECANEQGKFWNLHEYLYKNQPSESDTSMYTVDNLTKIAGQLGMNAANFKSCLSTNKYDKNVQGDLAAGQAAGVTGTPTIFINGLPVVGAQPYAAFKTIIDQQLK
jgi:protein-disulfide isomerase